MKLVIVRHGECDSRGTYIGSGSNISLNIKGIKQIENISKPLNDLLFNSKVQIITSDLLRSKESAQILSLNLDISKVIIDKSINEINFGEWEGLNYKQIINKWPELAKSWYNDPFSITPPEAENFTDFVHRVNTFYNDLIKFVDKLDYLIIVTHGGVIQLLLTKINNDSINNRWNYNISRGDYTIIDYNY